MTSSLTSLVGDKIEGGQYKYSDFVWSNADKHIYGIPLDARRVLKFNPNDNSHTFIGPVLRWGWKYQYGTYDGLGCIYCLPVCTNERNVLKIDTKNSTVTELDIVLPQQGPSLWSKGVLALDGNNYFMPRRARRMLKLDPRTDTVESVGDDIKGGPCKYLEGVLGIDGCIYGMPWGSKRILKYDPTSGATSDIGQEISRSNFRGGVLARDGCIYAMNRHHEILKIDTRNGDWSFVGNPVNLSVASERPTMGNDGCIYWPPPFKESHTMKYYPYIGHLSPVGNDYGKLSQQWYGGTATPDGVIYCAPSDASRILMIDPFRDFKDNLIANIQAHPLQLGRIFEIGEGGMTAFDLASKKYGMQRVLSIVNENLAPTKEVAEGSQLYPFMVAACPNGSLSAINFFLRQVPALMVPSTTNRPNSQPHANPEDSDHISKKHKAR